MRRRGRLIDDRDLALLGIKYEAATLGGVQGQALARIEAQVRSEAGEGWRSDPAVTRGRNAVRAEHGLPPLGEQAKRTAPPAARPPLWRRLFGGR